MTSELQPNQTDSLDVVVLGNDFASYNYFYHLIDSNKIWSKICLLQIYKATL